MTPDGPDPDEPRPDLFGYSPDDFKALVHPLAYIHDRVGRKIRVERIDLCYTYAGCYEGHLTKFSTRIRTHLNESLKREYPDNTPVQVVDNGEPVLPDVRVLVGMWSEQPTSRDEGMLSMLNLCFFLRKREATFENILDFASKAVEWDRYAKDGDY